MPLDAVVAAAGIGRATLYRHFPDRTALLLALFDREVETIRRAQEDAEPGEALLAMIAQFARLASQAPALMDGWRAVAADDPKLQARQRDVVALFKDPLAAAVKCGAVRPDLTIGDVVAVMRMVAVGASQGGLENRVAGDRILELVLNGVLRRG